MFVGRRRRRRMRRTRKRKRPCTFFFLFFFFLPTVDIQTNGKLEIEKKTEKLAYRITDPKTYQGK